MSKNYIIILMFALWLLTFFYFSCGNKPAQKNYVEDSLRNKLKQREQDIKELQENFDSVYANFIQLKAQKQTIKYETKTIWQTKYITDSIIHSYSDSETVKRFMFRFNTY